jgi:uncharacterized membrane protein (DUF441 family)
MKQAIINALIRAGRTFVQTFLSVLIPMLSGVATFAELTTVTALEAAAVAAIIAVLVNWLEELKGVTYNRG